MVTHPPFRAAIVGAGHIAGYHADGLRAAGAAIAALVGRDPARVAARAREFGIERGDTDLAAVLADPGIDGIVIATPDDTHLEFGLAALAAGKPVLMQKPMAMSSEQCRALLAAARPAPHLLSVSFMHRHFPEVRWLRALLAEGALGPVHSMRIRNATPGADWAEWFYRRGRVAGGVVMQLGVHGIDLVQNLLGPVARVSALLRTARPERRLADGRQVRTALEDNAAAVYRLACGVLVSHEMSYTESAGCDRFRLELYAERGTVWLRSERGPAAIHAPAVTGKEGWQRVPLDDEPPGRHHHSAWIAAAGGPGDDTAAAGLATMLVGEAIYRSAATGAAVDMEGAAPC